MTQIGRRLKAIQPRSTYHDKFGRFNRHGGFGRSLDNQQSRAQCDCDGNMLQDLLRNSGCNTGSDYQASEIGLKDRLGSLRVVLASIDARINYCDVLKLPWPVKTIRKWHDVVWMLLRWTRLRVPLAADLMATIPLLPQ